VGAQHRRGVHGGGLLSGLTGNRAGLGIVDDPIAGREEAESQTMRQKTWDAYIDDFCSRLVPGAPQVMILCMTGDTPVLMESGIEKALRDVRPGDRVATYDNGQLTASTVVNCANQGPDAVYEIRTISGITVKANERHPFLVETNRGIRWTKLRDIRVGDRILRVTGENGAASSVRRPNVRAQLPREDYAESTMDGFDGKKDIDHHQPRAGRERTSNFATDTASGSTNTRPCSRSKRAAAPSVGERLLRGRQSIGAKSFVSTIATKPEPSGGCFATTAISSSAGAETPNCCAGLSNTFSSDEVVSIAPAGAEEVFDIQVDRTENFIANGLVSHNTRWHEDDPAGRILPEGWDGESGLIEGRDGRTWYVVCLPAICDRHDDPLGREIGQTLWPEWFSQGHWAPFKRNPRTWASLYQQRPAPPSGSYFRKEWFDGGTIAEDGLAPQTFERRRYKPGDQPKNLRLYGTSDYAVTEGGGDFTVHRVWGVDAAGEMWLLPGGYRAQSTSDLWIEGVIDQMQAHHPFGWFGEAGVIQKAIEPALLRRMSEREARCRMEWLPSISDKATRARGFQARAAMGQVHLPEGPEGDAVLDEYIRFPAGRHDDDVDCASLMGRALDMAHPAIVPPDEKKSDQPRGVNEMTWDELMAQQGGRVERV
jgi:predicted phage terminase large subunit-like protein